MNSKLVRLLSLGSPLTGAVAFATLPHGSLSRTSERIPLHERTVSYVGTAMVMNGELMPAGADAVKRLRSALHVRNLLAANESKTRRSWGECVTLRFQRAVVHIEYRGPRGNRYHAAKATAHAADIYVHLKNVWSR